MSEKQGGEREEILLLARVNNAFKKGSQLVARI